MIELILTNTLDSKPVLDKLKNSLDQTKKHYIFVPDRFSLSYQKAVLEHLNIKGSFDIEVTSFVRMANKLLENNKKVLDKQSEIMLIRKVIEDNKDKLLSFGNVSNSVNFASDIYAAISQIRNSNISVSRMAEIVDDLPTRIANKTKDIITIYRAYIEFLQEGYTDGTSKLQALADVIYEGSLKDCNIYISDFMSFSDIEYELIKAIMLNSMNTYITLVDSNNDNKHIFPYAVKGRLYSIAQECGLSIKTNYVEQDLSGDAKIIHEELYGYSPTKSIQRDNKVEVYSCKSISQEIKSIAREINYLVREKGARYKDIAIVCCDYATYTPYFKSIFNDFAIPFYADIKQSLSNQALTKLILSGIQVISNQYSYKDVIALAKQVMLAFDYEEVCVFENYCLKYGIDYTRFLSPFEIGEENDRQIAEKIRQKLITIVEPLKIKKADVNGYVDAIECYLKALNYEKLVEWLAKSQEAKGYMDLSAITMQSLSKIDILLERFRAMLGNSKMPFEEFCKIFMTAVDSVEMSNIPLYIDSVFIGESSQSRYENIDYMFVVGANAGKFPLEHTDTGIVSEREYVAWHRMGVDVQPDCSRRNSLERLNVLMMLTRVKNKLKISYSRTATNGSELMPSSTVEYICQLLDITPLEIAEPDYTWSENDYLRYISAKGNVVQELLSLNNMYKQNTIQISDTFKAITDMLYTLACKENGKEYIDSLLSSKTTETQLTKEQDIMFRGNTTSVSQFEKYFKCPFLHYNENVLKLNKREINGFEVRDTGTLLHAVLEKYFSLPDCADKNDEEIQEIVTLMMHESIAENKDYAYLLQDSKNVLNLKQLCNQAVYVVKNLVHNMKCTKFRPYKLEAKFGFATPDSMKGMEIDNGYRKLSFCGVIDRIDKYDDRLIVVDYKSKGSIDFGPSNILYGDRIQLFVYLNALRNNGFVTPQGVFYLLMNNRYLNAKDCKNRFMFTGFVNSNEQYLNDLDSGFASNDTFASSVYPIKRSVTKKQEINYTASNGYLLTSEGFDDVCKYVITLTQKSAKEIEEGYIAKSPLNLGGGDDIKACAYCDYKNVCNRDGIISRNVKKINVDEFLQLLKEGVCQK